jgi:transglutaminase-like putative cysteine protease
VNNGEEKMHKKIICVLCILMLIFLPVSVHTEENSSKKNDDSITIELSSNSDLFTLSEVYYAVVRFTDLVTNTDKSSTPISVTTYLAIPPNLPTQDRLEPTIFAPDEDILDFVIDEWGNIFAKHARDINPFQESSTSWTEKVHLKKITYHIDPDLVTVDIPDNIADDYLGDAEKYDINNESLISSVVLAIAGETNPYRKAKGIHDFIIDRLFYLNVGGWDSAPEVLRQGSGSCTEYSWLFIAMCRIAGIPARHISGTYVDINTPYFPYVDTAHHRWAQIWLSPYGWVPVDVTLDDLLTEDDPPGSPPRDDYFGVTDNIFLVTSISGDRSQYLRWGYNAFDSTSYSIEIGRYGIWFGFERQSPNIPAAPSGPDTVNADEEVTYVVSTIDPNSENVYYWFDWGDNTNSGWLGPYKSGADCEASHTFVNYYFKYDSPVRVKAKDINDFESDWSSPLIVSTSKNKSITEYQSWMYWIIERFPILEFLL